MAVRPERPKPGLWGPTTGVVTGEEPALQPLSLSVSFPPVAAVVPRRTPPRLVVRKQRDTRAQQEQPNPQEINWIFPCLSPLGLRPIPGLFLALPTSHPEPTSGEGPLPAALQARQEAKQQLDLGAHGSGLTSVLTSSVARPHGTRASLLCTSQPRPQTETPIKLQL